jgi:hypothetical protein
MGTLDYKVIDNFLDKEFFNSFKNLLFSSDINWFWKNHMTEEDNYFFNHCFYIDNVPMSPFFGDYIFPILKKLNVHAILQIRANLLLKNKISYQSNFHVDSPFECKTAILYMNTCNGCTILDKNEKIKITSEENKILIFNSQIEHAAASQTDVDRRIVINFNYF